MSFFSSLTSSISAQLPNLNNLPSLDEVKTALHSSVDETLGRMESDFFGGEAAASTSSSTSSAFTLLPYECEDSSSKEAELKSRISIMIDDPETFASDIFNETSLDNNNNLVNSHYVFVLAEHEGAIGRLLEDGEIGVALKQRRGKGEQDEEGFWRNFFFR